MDVNYLLNQEICQSVKCVKGAENNKIMNSKILIHNLTCVP